MSDRPGEWEDLEAWEAEFEDHEDGARRSRRGLIWIALGVILLVLIWYVWLAALLNPDNYRLPVDPTPPVTPWEQGAAEFGLDERDDVGSLITRGFLAQIPPATTEEPDLRISGGRADVIASQSGDSSSWMALWIGGHLLLQAVGLVVIARRRHTMGTRHVVKWTLLLLFVPIAGVLGFYFYLLESSIQRGVAGRQEEAAPFLRSPAR
ncbi:MAG: hypothetical protein QNJ89_14880 [Acidimicrobiia bacterium]|nr:hypothetical protein [Acidimicrobiia bacterium]